MESATDVLGDFPSPDGDFTLTFDDDGKAAYAYLKRGDTVLGDVWGYNRCPTPERPEWNDRRNLPFANSKEYAKDEGHVQRPVTLDDLRVEWRGSGEQTRANLYLFGDRVAAVGVNDRPGYCRFAAKDGPLAKVLAEEPP